MSALPSQRIRVTKRFHFEMAHALTGHDGACAHVHGHSYALEVTVLGVPIDNPSSPKNGMVIDFTDLKAIVQREVVARFDHAFVLNERQSLSDMSEVLFGRSVRTPYQPTCENLLQDIAARIMPALPSGVRLIALKLQETPTSYAEWRAEDNG